MTSTSHCRAAGTAISIRGIDASSLPGKFTGGFAFMFGLDVKVLRIEIKQNTSEDKVSGLADVSAGNGLYEIESAGDNFYQVLTTVITGTFVLVKK